MTHSVPLAAGQQPDHAVLEEAAEWYALMRSGHASEQDKLQWQAWLVNSDDHKIAWSYVEDISRSFAPLQTMPDPKLASKQLVDANSRLKQRRRILLCITGLIGTGVAGITAFKTSMLPDAIMAFGADYRTGTGEQREITLSDGTSIWLNTHTAINSDYTTSLRRLELLHGEVHIQTAKDVTRAFVIDTKYGRMQALGTRFNVRQTDNATLLTVYEGVVQISTTNHTTAIIHAGQQTAFTDNTIDAVNTAHPVYESWTKGTLVAFDMPLSDVIAELRRYHMGHIGVDPRISHLKVYGNFPIHDKEQALRILSSALPIEVHTTLPWWISLQPRVSATP